MDIRTRLAGLFAFFCVLFALRPAHAKDRAYQSFEDWYYTEGFCYGYDEWSDETPTLDARPDVNYSGYAPRPVPDLDCWLSSAHPEMAAALKWQAQFGKVAYPDWSYDQQSDLQQSFAYYWNWFEFGYPGDGDYLSTGYPFPVNQATDGETRLLPDEAWHYFVDVTGMALAAQLGHWFAWDLRSYNYIYYEDLRYLLDSEEMFLGNYWTFETDNEFTYRVIPVDPLNGWPTHGAVTLTSPMKSLLFLLGNGLIRASAEETLYAALDWGRDHLLHFNGGLLDPSVEQAVWQYGGQPPVQQIIDGTQSTQAGEDAYGVVHWTMGCHGTAGFYKAVLRTASIPVHVDGNRFHSGMGFPIGPWAVAAHITHADDIYAQTFRDQNLGLPYEHPTTGPTSSAGLFVDDSEYVGLFDSNLHPVEEIIANVDWSLSRYIAYWQPVPTTYTMRAYCSDLARGVSHADGDVYGLFTYSGVAATNLGLQVLENNALWEWLEDRRVNYPGGCSAFTP